MNWVLLFLLVLIASCTATQQPPLAATVCAVADNPKSFNGKVIRFRAHIFSDHMHGSYLIDRTCGKSITLGFVEKVPQKEQEVLDRAMRPLAYGTYDDTLEATFTGKFIVTPPNGYKTYQTMELEAYRVERVTSRLPTYTRLGK